MCPRFFFYLQNFNVSVLTHLLISKDMRIGDGHVGQVPLQNAQKQSGVGNLCQRKQKIANAWFLKN